METLKRHWVAVAVVAAVLVLGIGGLLVANAMRGAGASSQSANNSSSAPSADPESVKLAAGLKAFNTAYTSKSYRAIESMGKVYVSVGWAADYPDQMLVTLVVPSMSQSDASAWQYMFEPSTVTERLYPKLTYASNVPDSVKVWNAHLDADGNVLLDGYETESAP